MDAKVAIIGAGWYGCHLGLMLDAMGCDVNIFEKNNEKLRNLGSVTYEIVDSLGLARRAAEEGEMEESASHHLFDAPGVSRGPRNIRNRSCENVPGSPGNIENTQLLELRAIHV